MLNRAKSANLRCTKSDQLVTGTAHSFDSKWSLTAPMEGEREGTTYGGRERRNKQKRERERKGWREREREGGEREAKKERA